jgi:hypothetical protein
VLDPFQIAHNLALYALHIYKMNKLVHSYSILLSVPGRFNYSIAFAMLVSVYMRRMGGWFVYNVPGRYNYSIAFAMLVSVYMRRMGGWFVYSVNIANNLTSNRPKSVLLGKVGAQFMIWRYLEPFSICVPLMYPLRTDPGITSPYFIICVAI